MTLSRTIAVAVVLLAAVAQADVFTAICRVESGGNRLAFNRGAAGVAQIRPCVVRDLDRHGYQYTLADRWSVAKSREIFAAYMRLYKAHTDSERARCWRSGRGQMNSNTARAYWVRVRKGM